MMQRQSQELMKFIKSKFVSAPEKASSILKSENFEFDLGAPYVAHHVILLHFRARVIGSLWHKRTNMS